MTLAKFGAGRSTETSPANCNGEAASVDARIVRPDGETPPPREYQSYWPWVMCLVGVHCFSTLAYQPTIAFQALGLLAPLGTIALVALMLFAALPVYRRVAHKSPYGHGSIGLIERMLSGWAMNLLVLILLGFAASHFMFTTTVSAADAAQHLIHNPFFTKVPAVLQNQMFMTMTLVVLLGAMLLCGFRQWIMIAVVLVAVYLFLNLVIIFSGFWHLATHPEMLSTWHENITAGRWYLEHAPAGGSGMLSTVLICLLWFPALALGLAGLETGLAAMPLVRGDTNDNQRKPEGRIRNTQKLLTTAALIMSFMLLGSSVVTSLLINPDALLSSGPAAQRALAFIAHGSTAARINPLFGPMFGTLYDMSTVAILSFAGASAMSALLTLATRYLSQCGITPNRSRAIGLLVLLFTAINLFLSWFFAASVEAQAGAYIAGVLALACNACLVVTIVDWNRRRGRWYARFSWRYFGVLLIFLFMTIAISVRNPESVMIAAAYSSSLIVFSIFWPRNTAQALQAH